MARRYTVLLEWDPDGPGYAVTVPALPGCFSQGATVPEALARAREAIAGHVAALIDMGEPVPQEDTPALMTVVEVEDFAPTGD
jgi:predicted RNase H-like HicB family nuclease